METDLLERCPGESLQQCVGSGSLPIRQLRLYRSLRSLGGGFLCENDPKVFSGLGGGAWESCKDERLWRVFVSVIKPSQVRNIKCRVSGNRLFGGQDCSKILHAEEIIVGNSRDSFDKQYSVRAI